MPFRHGTRGWFFIKYLLGHFSVIVVLVADILKYFSLIEYRVVIAREDLENIVERRELFESKLLSTEN